MTNRGTAYIVYRSSTGPSVNPAELAISHMHEAQLDGAVINQKTHAIALRHLLHPIPMAPVEALHHPHLVAVLILDHHPLHGTVRLLAVEEGLALGLSTLETTSIVHLPTHTAVLRLGHRPASVDHPIPAHDPHHAVDETGTEIDQERETVPTRIHGPELHHRREDEGHQQEEVEEGPGVGALATVAIAAIQEVEAAAEA
ncbi:MAG: hypothetical protein Q9160_005418 [Pyrenula sp. 1 TL-2023]